MPCLNSMRGRGLGLKFSMVIVGRGLRLPRMTMFARVGAPRLSVQGRADLSPVWKVLLCHLYLCICEMEPTDGSCPRQPRHEGGKAKKMGSRAFCGSYPNSPHSPAALLPHNPRSLPFSLFLIHHFWSMCGLHLRQMVCFILFCLACAMFSNV